MTFTLDELDSDTTLLTVNNRLATELRRRYDRMQVATGRQVWPSADILPLGAWLQRLYTELLDTGRIERDVVGPYAERLLWEDAIDQDDADAGLLRPSAAAEMARQAHALCREWRLSPETLAGSGGDDTRSFLVWWRRVERAFEQRQLLSAAALPELLAGLCADGCLTLPKRMAHAGFDTLSPVQQALFAALEQRGCEVRELREPPRRSERRRVELPDRETEMRLAASWALDRLRDAPDARIGIVSPHLDRQRADLERVFTEILAPARFLMTANDTLPFNISLGEPLADHSMVGHGLLALRLLGGPLSLAETGQLLRSPFIGGHREEWERRALFDVSLRDDGQPMVDVGQLHYRLQQWPDDDARSCPDLGQRIDALRTLRQGLPATASPNRWAAELQAALRVLGWPGDGGLDSHEFQQHERLLRVFSEFAAVGRVRPRMRLAEALSQLNTLAAEAVFQPQSGPAPIQILGGLEAAGMAFDAIWLLGMDDHSWPPAPQANPLLPIRLQRELGMPHASAERELAFAGQLTERLAASATLLIASHAARDGDREQGASPLTADWPLTDAAALAPPSSTTLREACRATDRLLPMPLPQARQGPHEAAGGASLLATQASCPFSALARFRLGARPLAEPTFAPDPAMQGSLVHEALQRIWQALHSSSNLAALERPALENLVTGQVEAVLAGIGRRRPDLFTPRFCVIETQRLTRLLLDWLDCERARSQPFEVLALEQDRMIDLGAVALRTRADRVDRLADGSLAVIDYKTGSRIASQGWFDDRLSEPQLPLYCLHEEGDVCATLLARVRRDGPGCTFVGLSRSANFAPGVSTPESQFPDTDWPRLLQHWQTSIADLVDEIDQGRADPTPSPQACQYCPLGALCRVRDMLAEAEDD